MHELTTTEMGVLCGELEHAPSCAWTDGQAFYVDDAGGEWVDEEATVPYVEPPCTCGYFAHLESARAKLRAAMAAAND